MAGNAAYGTSKTAVRFLTRVAAIEGAPHHIRVNSVSPGAVATPMWAGTDWWPEQVAARDGQEAALKALVAERGFGRPEEIAAALLYLASDEARLITGVDLPMDAGFSNLMRFRSALKRRCPSRLPGIGRGATGTPPGRKRPMGWAC